MRARRWRAKRQTRNSIPSVAMLMALVVFGVGIAISAKQWMDDKAAARHAQQLVDAANHGAHNNVPSTVKPSPAAFDSYTVPADYPRYLAIPKLNVHAIVRSLGVTPDNQVLAPDTVYDAGWYDRSSRPGQPGAMLVDGHVSSWTTHGIFYGLDKLVPGDTVQIERGDGKLLNYKVVKSVVYSSDKVDMAAALTPVSAKAPGLNLMTCAGSVIQGTNEFDKRIVVFTEQI